MDLFHYERFEPDLGENHKLPPEQRLYLEVACGLTKVQLKAVKRAANFSKLAPSIDAAMAEAKTSKAEDETETEALERVVEQQMAAGCVEQLVAGWSPYVRFGSTRHTINGRAVATLKDYLEVTLEQRGRFNIVELSRVIAQLNSVTGTQALFLERLSGGPISMAGPRTDEAESPTGSR